MPTLPAAQRRTLLDLADADRQLRTARHRKETLPEQQRLDELVVRHRELGRKHGELAEEQKRLAVEVQGAETDVAALSSRIAGDTSRLNSGEGLTSRDLISLQEEIDGLKARLESAEEAELDLLDRKERLDAEIAELKTEAEEVARDGKAAAAARGQALDAVEKEIAELTDLRTRLAAEIPAPVLRAYQQVVDAGGVGAAQQEGSGCPGCGRQLSEVDLRTLAALPEDQVFECEDCGCLIVPAA